MTGNPVPDNLEIVVEGRDMFGAPFTERAQLLHLEENEFSLSMFRPVAESDVIRVNFRPQDAAELWITGQISSVKSRLDGKQTVEVKILGTARVSSRVAPQEQLVRLG